MTEMDNLRRLGLFDARVPRYTSYPTAPTFSTGVGAGRQEEWLEGLDPAAPVSIYVHIPFCERLCWFCACHTQGTRTLGPVESYLDALEAELRLVAARLPSGVRMGRLHWGGGTPTILSPSLIHRWSVAIRAAIPPAERFEFSVEIGPTMVDRARIDALAEEGLARDSIGIQDFDRQVQEAIGRLQSYEATRACVGDLRAAGVRSLNADIVYGLPHQSEARIVDTVEKVLTLAPDRVAVFGYAHVPWPSKRQKLIDAAALPGDEARYRLSQLAAGLFELNGYRGIGIDHFARPGDGLDLAARTGRLRRNFQGYTDDTCPTLIGLGASSISRFEGGYVQNAAATAGYLQRIGTGMLPGAREHVFSADDRLRGRGIEMLMCDFHLAGARSGRSIGRASRRSTPSRRSSASGMRGSSRRGTGRSRSCRRAVLGPGPLPAPTTRISTVRGDSAAPPEERRPAAGPRRPGCPACGGEPLPASSRSAEGTNWP